MMLKSGAASRFWTDAWPAPGFWTDAWPARSEIMMAVSMTEVLQGKHSTIIVLARFIW